jgi:hypothetical protein
LDFGDEEIPFCEKGAHLKFVVCGSTTKDTSWKID